jgi:uncharacterized membrane protein
MSNMKKIFSTEETIEKHLHKIYLVLALFIGTMLSLAMPLFNEPDGQYHYTVSTNMVGLSNDLSAYGEPNIGSGMFRQVPNYQSGTFFEKYFKSEIKEMPMEDLPRAAFIPPKTSYNYWGHLLPAIGVKLGHTIYPSIGVMIVIARLLSSFICAILMFLIIKWVKAGKLLFTVVSLSPVITNTFASLSYDATTYILSAFAIAFTINMIVRKQLRLRDVWYLGISIISLTLGAKTNLKLLIFLPTFVMLLIYLVQEKHNSRFGLFIDKIKYQLKRKKWICWKSFMYVGIFILLLLITFLILKPTVAFSLYRITIGYWINISPGLSVSSIFQSLLAAPYANFNHLPYWVSVVWYILLIIVVLVEKRFVESLLISWFAFLVFLGGLVAVFYSFVTQPTISDYVEVHRFLGAVEGVQGRYFTPTLLLLPLVTGNEKFQLRIRPYRLTVIISIAVIIITNIMLVFSTLFGIYFLY